MDTYIIGIAGASGSGKTTFVKELVKKFTPKEVCLISFDDYYKDRHLQPLDDNGIENYDTLESIDIEAFESDLQKLKSGESFTRKEYDFNNPDYKTEVKEYFPTPVVILEGLFLFSYESIYKKLDLKIFIEAEEHLRITRRLERDLVERGYTVEQTLYWLRKHVEPAYKTLVHPYKSEADVIIPNNKNFNAALDLVSGFIKHKIQ